MVRSPFIMLPTNVSGSGHFVDLAQVRPLFATKQEVEARAHWLFGTDNPEFKDLVAGQALTQVGVNQPILEPGLVRFGAGNNSLRLPFDDPAERTVCVVYKHTAKRAYGMICGAWEAGNTICNNWIDASNYRLQTVSAAGQQIDLLMTAPAGLVAGQWTFLAFSHGPAGVRVLWGENTYSHEVVKRVIAGQKMQIGPAHSQADDKTAVAEYIQIDRALSFNEMRGVRARSFERLAPRAVAVTA